MLTRDDLARINELSTSEQLSAADEDGLIDMASLLLDIDEGIPGKGQASLAKRIATFLVAWGNNEQTIAQIQTLLADAFEPDMTIVEKVEDLIEHDESNRKAAIKYEEQVKTLKAELIKEKGHVNFLEESRHDVQLCADNAIDNLEEHLIRMTEHALRYRERARKTKVILTDTEEALDTAYDLLDRCLSAAGGNRSGETTAEIVEHRFAELESELRRVKSERDAAHGRIEFLHDELTRIRREYRETLP